MKYTMEEYINKRMKLYKMSKSLFRKHLEKETGIIAEYMEFYPLINYSTCSYGDYEIRYWKGLDNKYSFSVLVEGD